MAPVNASGAVAGSLTARPATSAPITAANTTAAPPASLRALLAEIHTTCAPLISREAATKLSKAATEAHEQWETRTAALQELLPLFQRAADEEVLEWVQEAVSRPLASQLEDLRSSVVRVACDVVTALLKAHGRAIAPLVTALLPSLLHNACNVVKVIANSSSTVALLVAETVPTPPLLACLLHHSSDKHAQTRRAVCDSFAAAIAQGAPISERLVGETTKALGRLTADSDVKAREAAGRAFWALHSRFPAAAEALRNGFTRSQLALVKRLEPGAA